MNDESSSFEEGLFAAATALPPGERADFLRRTCGDDVALRQRLEALLREHEGHRGALDVELVANMEDLGRILEQRAHSTGPNLSDDAMLRVLGSARDDAGPAEAAGTWIGPYKLLQEIGRGGFGVVWMAEQEEPIRRRVALKIIKSGMDTREVIARFEAERQALALMDHPNIARVFDAGATGSGRPFFVMELVRGVAITRYCDENKLTADERLRLFVSVCHAVQHAHQKGIIHRDLKPSNIIVTQHDGVPAPKVIDFGIAKATSGTRLTDQTLFTQFLSFLGTPAYTSPEQVEMSGLDVDTRSDIYSLGVLLYELLAGRPPFDPDTLAKSGLEAMRRTIRETEPPRPSQRLTTLSDEDRTSVAQQRGTDVGKLSLLLRGDLDWIVMRCLEKDRTRRYETASSLVLDVQRYLDSEPVAARPPRGTYRLRKFIHRHKLGVLASAAVLGSLIAGLVTASILLVRERAARERAVAAEYAESQQRQQAEARTKEARIAAARSAQVAQFMKDMLNGVGPAVARGRDTTMLREILDHTARRLETALQDQPEVAADLQDTLGPLYRYLGQYPTAVELLRQAVATRRAVYGNESAELANSLYHLADALAWNFQTPEAEPFIREVVAIREKLYGPEHPEVLVARAKLFAVLKYVGNLDEAEAIGRDVLNLQRKVLGEEHPDVATSLFELGAVMVFKGRPAEGVEFARAALAIRRKGLGNEHLDVADALFGLGQALRSQGKDSAAEAAAYRECLEIRRKLLGDGHQQVGVAALELAQVLVRDERRDQAIAMLRDVTDAARKIPTRDNTTLGVGLLVLESLLEGEGQAPDEVSTLRREAHALFETARVTRTPVSRHAAGAMRDFGGWMFLTGRPADALPILRENFKFAQAAQDPVVILDAGGLLAFTCLSAGRASEAVPLFEDILPQSHKLLGAGHLFTLLRLSGLGEAYRETGRWTDSQRALEEGLGLVDGKNGEASEPDPVVAAVRCELGLTLIRQGKFAEAESVLRRALTDYDREKGPTFWQRLRPRGRAVIGLGQALAAQGKFEEAEPLVVHAFQELQANENVLAGDRRRILREAAEAVVQVYTAWGKIHQADEWRKKIEPAPANR